MEGSGAVSGSVQQQKITNPDPGEPKTYGSGSGTLVNQNPGTCSANYNCGKLNNTYKSHGCINPRKKVLKSKEGNLKGI
jgi:hypothetical protein